MPQMHIPFSGGTRKPRNSFQFAPFLPDARRHHSVQCEWNWTIYIETLLSNCCASSPLLLAWCWRCPLWLPTCQTAPRRVVSPRRLCCALPWRVCFRASHTKQKRYRHTGRHTTVSTRTRQSRARNGVLEFGWLFSSLCFFSLPRFIEHDIRSLRYGRRS